MFPKCIVIFIIKLVYPLKFNRFGIYLYISTYALTILPSPGELFLNDIEKIILNFFWDDKPAKIKKTILFKEKTEGGLNLTNIKIYAKSVKFQWIYKLYNEDYNAFWKHLICARCSRLQDKIILTCILNKVLCHLSSSVNCTI
jgi:hypothetical protein